MAKRIVVANWKMYVEDLEAAKKFATHLRKQARVFAGVDAVVAPPFPFIASVAEKLKGSTIAVGGQSLTGYLDAPHTGDVSAAMLKSAGATYVIVGHSERRAYSTKTGQAGETDEDISQQIRRASEAKLTVILCVGERERDDHGAHFGLITTQLTAALKPFVKEKMPKLIVAYEPVWAIGKTAAEAMGPADVREMSIFIKKTLAEVFDRAAALKVPILYGGSVEPLNARPLIEEGGINGFLVGHASADVDSFISILKSCKK